MNNENPTSLNHVFASWANIGRPSSMTCLERYMKVDGHAVRCSGTFRVERATLPTEILEATPAEKELAVWAESEKGKKYLVIGYGVAGDLYACARIWDAPRGCYCVNDPQSCERRPFQPFESYGEIVAFGHFIREDMRKKQLSAVTATA